MNSWAITDRGIVRKQNQDAYYTYCSPDGALALCVVCDGMGGANAGNIASTATVEKFVDRINSFCTSQTDDIPVGEMMVTATKKVNRELFDMSVDNDDLRGMGTTIVAAVIVEDKAAVINVGDSRAYHISGDTVRQITKDHSVVEELVDSGKISLEEAKHHPNRNLITRAVGTAPTVDVDLFMFTVNEGDYLLLCTDGLTNVVSEEEILEILKGNPPDKCCEELVALVISRGAPDNVTLTLLKK